MSPSYAVILVYATSHAMRIEKLLRKAAVPCKLIPVPRHLSSDCGVCVRLDSPNLPAALAILKEENAEYEGAFEL